MSTTQTLTDTATEAADVRTVSASALAPTARALFLATKDNLPN